MYDDLRPDLSTWLPVIGIVRASKIPEGYVYINKPEDTIPNPDPAHHRDMAQSRMGGNEGHNLVSFQRKSLEKQSNSSPDWEELNLYP